MSSFVQQKFGWFKNPINFLSDQYQTRWYIEYPEFILMSILFGICLNNSFFNNSWMERDNL